MKQVLFLAFLVLIATAAEVTEDEGVLVLNEQNFDQVLGQNEFILVEFYAPWCGHCKSLKPEYEKAAAQLKTLEKPVPLAKVDATENANLAQKFGVEGYPTLKFFTNGQPMDYSGGRTDKEIVSWIQKRVGHITTEIKDQEALDKFIASNQVAVIYYGDSESDSHWAPFRQAAMSFEKVAFAHTFNSQLFAGQKVESGKVVLYKKFDEGRNDFEGSFTLEDLKAFVNEKSFATVMQFDDRAIEKVFQQGNPTLFLFHTKSEQSQLVRQTFETAAKQLKGGKVIFSVSHPDDGHGHFQRLAEYIGVNTANVPAMMLIHVEQDVSKYQYTGDFSLDSIVNFVNAFNSKSLQKYFKTEEIPEKNDGPVKVIVGKSWEKEVINNNKDVLVKFYAPWCGHCKNLAPHWEEAGKLLAGNPNIVIAKVDATLNEVTGVSVRGFPTLKFYPGNDKSNPIDFDGDRTTEGIVSWLKTKSTHPWVEGGKQHTDDL